MNKNNVSKESLENQVRFLKSQIRRWASWECDKTELAYTSNCKQSCIGCQARETLAVFKAVYEPRPIEEILEEESKNAIH